jgi:hypothetical protein
VFAGISILGFHRIVLNPLPLPMSGQLQLAQRISKTGQIGFTDDQVQQIANANVFASVGGYTSAQMTIPGPDPVRVNVISGTPSLSDTLGVAAILGRTLTGYDAFDAVVDESLWRGLFAADSAIVGRPLVLDGSTFRIVGVVPTLSLLEDRPFQVWIQFPRRAERSRVAFLTTIGRLRPGVPTADAERRLTSILALDPGVRVSVASLNGVVLGNVKEITVLILLGAVSILAASSAVVVLLILIHLTSAQQLHGFVVRRVLGASQSLLAARLMGTLAAIVVPACIVALAGLVFLDHGLLNEYAPRARGATGTWGVDGAAALLVSLIAVCVTTVCFVPVFLYVTGARLDAGLTRSGRTSLRDGSLVRGIVLTSVIATTLSFGIAAERAFMAVSRMHHRQIGFQPQNRFAALIPPAARARDLVTERGFWQQLLSEAGQDGRLGDVAATSTVPLFGSTSAWFMPSAGGPEISLEVVTASPGLLKTLGIDLVRGREFSAADNGSNAPVAILNESAARLLYGSGEAALNRTLAVPGRPTIVGVGGDHVSRVANWQIRPVVWRPYLQHTTVANALIIHQRGMSIRNAGELIRTHVRRIDPTRSVEMLSLETVVERPLRRPRLAMYLMLSFATTLLVFCCCVMVGNLLFVLRLQRRDNALKMALGANSYHLVWAQLRAAGVPLLVGTAFGCAGATALVHFLSSLFENITGLGLATTAVTCLGVAALGTAIVVASTRWHGSRCNVWSELGEQ